MTNDMSSEAISKGIVSVGTWSATKIVVSGLIVPIYSRLLGVEGYGQYAYYLALLLLCAHPANCGMRQALTKYVAERPDETGRVKRLAAYAGRINTIGAVLVGAALGLLLLSSDPSVSAVVMAAVVVGLLWSGQVQEYAGGILFGLRQEAKSTGPASIGVILGGVFGVIFVVVGWGVPGALGGSLLAGLLASAVSLWYARQAVGSLAPESHATPIHESEFLHFGLTSMIYAAFAMALYSIDLVLVRHLAGDEQAGRYAAAVQWAEFVWFIPIAVEGVMIQSTAQLWAHNRREALTDLVSRLMRYVTLATAYVLLMVFVLAEPIVTFYFGSNFQSAALPLQCLVPGAFVFSLARIVRPVIQAGGWVTTLLRIVLVGVGTNVLLNVVCIPRWGAAGAGVATSASFMVVAAWYVVVLRRRGVHVVSGPSIWRWCWLSLATSGMLVFVKLAVSSPLPALLLGVVVATVCYWSGAFWLKLICVDEAVSFADSLPGPVRAVSIRLLNVVKPALIRIESMAWH